MQVRTQTRVEFLFNDLKHSGRLIIDQYKELGTSMRFRPVGCEEDTQANIQLLSAEGVELDEKEQAEFSELYSEHWFAYVEANYK